MKTQTQEDERLQFIRLLYRNESGVSDHVSPSRLKELNIKTNLDDVVRKAVRAGSSVVVTGNAGDGKTHAILLMRKELRDAEVITDANGNPLPPDAIIKKIMDSPAGAKIEAVTAARDEMRRRLELQGDVEGSLARLDRQIADAAKAAKKSSTSSALGTATWQPTCGTMSTRPSVCRRFKASITGTRLQASACASAGTARRSPGARSPSRMRAFRCS